MQNSPDKITAFEKQIEGSIELQISQLRTLDEKKSKALSALKVSILESIKQDREDKLSPPKFGKLLDINSTPEKEEKYSADLRLTKAELKQVFEEVKKGNQQIFSENRLEDFWEFTSFIGLDNDEVSFADSLQEVTVFGKKIELALPLGINDLIAKNFKAAIQQIESRTDLEPFIKAGLKLIPRGGMRLEFTVQKDGQEVQYSATPEQVLRIDQAPPPEQIKEWTQTELKSRNLERNFRETLRADKSLGSRQRYGIMDMLHGDRKMMEEEELKIPAKYQTIIDQIKALRKQAQILKEQCSVRMLFDEASEKAIRETGDPRYPANFTYKYLAQDGSAETKISYVSDIKSEETQYFPNSKQAQIKKYFHENGNTSSTTTYRPDGESLSESSYRQDGTLETKRKGQNEDVYDESGTNIMYRRRWPSENSADQVKTVMVGSNGESFATLDFMQQQSAEMSEEQYLDYLADNLDTPQKLHLFFELFMRYVYDKPEKAGEEHYTPYLKGSEYWQTPKETISRIKEGKMLGDCDDYAVLAKEILRRQDKTSYILSIPGHAICVWFEKNSHGNWDAYSMGTFGLDKNGNRQGSKPVDPKKAKGYPTLEEALNSLMVKYDKTGRGVDTSINYRIINGKVQLLHIPEKGKRTLAIGIPVELLPKEHIVDRLLEAQGLAEIGEYDKAIEGYHALLQVDPDHATLYHTGLANMLKSPQYDKFMAETEILALISQYPDRPEYHDALGTLYKVKFKDANKAQEQFLLAIEKGCEDPNTYIEVADSYSFRQNISKKIDVLELMVQSCPNISHLYHQYLAIAYQYSERPDRLLKTIQTYKEIIKNNPNATSAKIALADLYYKTDRNKSIELLEEIIQSNPADPKIYEHLGEFYKFKDRTKAIQYFRSAIEKGSTSQTPYREVANYYESKGQFEKQVQVLELALVKVPAANINLARYLELASAYSKTGNIEKAIQTYESTLGKDVRVIEPLAYLYYSHQNDLDKARQVYFRNEPQELKNNPGNPNHQKHLARFYELLLDKTFKQNFSRFDTKYQTGYRYDTIKVNPELLSQYPDIALLHSERIKALTKLCQTKEAKYYDYKNLAQLYLQQGKEEMAIQTLQAGLKKTKSSGLRSPLAGLLLAQGDINQALQVSNPKSEGLSRSVFRRLDTDAKRNGATQESIITFYDQLIAQDKAPSWLYHNYLSYLSDENVSEKLSIVVAKAIKRFPKEKKDFEGYIEN